jgi:hypothetical protein
VDLPEPVDVITSELIGHFGLEENLNRYQIDFRDRCLKPGGRLVPEWLELWIVPAQTPELWDEAVGMWANLHGVDYSAVTPFAVDQRLIMHCSGKAETLADPVRLSRTDFRSDSRIEPVMRASASIRSDGDLHGWIGFFKAGLSPGVCLSTAIDAPKTHWQHAFFPLEQPTPVHKGDTLELVLKTIPDRNTVFWEWDTRILRKGNEVRHERHSNFHLTRGDLLLGREDYTPKLHTKGEVLRAILSMADGQHSMGAIADTLMQRFPDEWKSRQEALQAAIKILSRHADIPQD